MANNNKGPKEVECRDKDCENTFMQYNSTQVYCCLKCKLKNQKDKKPKEIYTIPKVGKKRIVENAQYSVLRTQFLSKKENKVCPITGGPTTDVHHKKGRIGNLLLDTNYWLAVSREGHKRIEENPVWAKEMGYSLSRLENN